MNSELEREFQLRVLSFGEAQKDPQARLKEAALVLYSHGLPMVADFLQEIEEEWTPPVEVPNVEEELSDLAGAIRLVAFLGKPKGKKKHPVFDAWSSLCSELSQDTKLNSTYDSDVDDLLDELAEGPVEVFVRKASEHVDLRNAVRSAIMSREDGLRELLNDADLQDLIIRVVEYEEREVFAPAVRGKLLPLLETGDVKDLVWEALHCEDRRAEVLSAVAEFFQDDR